MAEIASRLPEQRNRNNFLDNAKFILIILVVMGHFIEPLLNYSRFLNVIFITIYTFHMPVFVLIAGYFSKKLKKPKDLIFRFVPLFLLFQLLYYLANNYIFALKFNLASLILLPHWIMWFLLSLLLWRLYLPFIIKLKHPIFFSIVLSIIAGYCSYIGIIMSLSRTITFLPFFLMGYYLDNNRIFQMISYRNKFNSIIYFLTLALSVYYLNPPQPVRELLFGYLSYENIGFSEWYAGFYRLILLIFQLTSSAFFLLLIPNERKFYSALGAKTMAPYLLHGFLILLFHYFDLWTKINTNLEIIILIFFAVVCAFVLTLTPGYIRSVLASFRIKSLSWLKAVDSKSSVR